MKKAVASAAGQAQLRHLFVRTDGGDGLELVTRESIPTSIAIQPMTASTHTRPCFSSDSWG